MEIDTNILATLVTGCLGAVGWLFKTTNDQDKEIVVLQTKIENTNSTVSEIKSDIADIREDIRKANRDVSEANLQIITAITEINATLSEMRNHDRPN